MRNLGGTFLACILALGGCTKDDNAPIFDAGPDASTEPDAMGSNAPEECDTINNDCPPELPKCTVIQTGMPLTLETECLEVTGTNMEGDTCMRAGNAVGRDNCDIALFCSGLAIAPMGCIQPRVCRSFCVTDTDCSGPGGDTCLEFGFDDPSQPGMQAHPGVEGLCVPSCMLFGACAAGLSCSLQANNDAMTLFGMCRPLGGAQAGSTCVSSNDCAADLTCLFSGATGTCFSNCDDAHPCAAPATCVTEQGGMPFGLPNGGGFCSG